MKRKDPATKNQKFLAVFLALTMLLSACMIYFTGNSDKNSNNDISSTENVEEGLIIPFSQIPGKQVHHKFNSIADGLNMTPRSNKCNLCRPSKAAGTPFEQIVGNTSMLNWLYGANVTKVYNTNYVNGSNEFELHLIPEQKIFAPIGAIPYKNYYLLARTNSTYDI